jgi:hypothetical protein
MDIQIRLIKHPKRPLLSKRYFFWAKWKPRSTGAKKHGIDIPAKVINEILEISQRLDIDISLAHEGSQSV